MEQTITQQIINTQARIKELEQQVLFGAEVQKLRVLPEFRKVIVEDFMQKEVVRNMALAGDPSASAEIRSDCLAMAYAGGHLHRYMDVQLAMARQAEHDLKEHKDLLDELREADAAEGQ